MKPDFEEKQTGLTIGKGAKSVDAVMMGTAADPPAVQRWMPETL